MHVLANVVLFLTALLLMLPAAVQAQVINACVNKKGSTRIVTKTPSGWRLLARP